MRVIFWTDFKNFSFFPRISWLFIFLSIFPSFKITVFTNKISIFFLTSSPILKKRYGFCFFLNVFHISCLRFLELGVFDDICEYDAWIWVFDALVRLWCGFFLVMCCYTLPLVAQCVIYGTHTFNDMIETLISWFGTNLMLIKFVVMCGFSCSLVQHDAAWKCLRSREQLWKAAATKGKSPWLMLTTVYDKVEEVPCMTFCVFLKRYRVWLFILWKWGFEMASRWCGIRSKPQN